MRRVLPLVSLVLILSAATAQADNRGWARRGQGAPVNLAPPSISGKPTAGQTLIASAGSWGAASPTSAYRTVSGRPGANPRRSQVRRSRLRAVGAAGKRRFWSSISNSYSYVWRRCDSAGGSCSTISIGANASYTLTPADVGATTRVTVTAANSAGSVSVTSAKTAVVRRAPAQAPPAVKNAGGFGFAAAGSLETWSSTDLGRYMDGIQAAGGKWVRVGLYWCSIQRGGRTSYSWEAFDKVVRAARARGLKVLGLLIYTPAWARPAGTTPEYPPTNLADFAAYAKAASAHFGVEGVHAYEIWNEPNITGFWKPAPDAARYTRMLKLGYAAIKSVDPSATVVSAGLSPGGSYGIVTTSYTNPLTYLERMYAHGAHGSMNAVGWHPYNFPWGLGVHRWSAWSQMADTTPSARSLMTANGDGTKQIWATEFGAPTGSSTQAVTESGQAQMITDAYAKLKSVSWAGPLFVYSFRDNGTESGDREQNFGILRHDWSPKPAYAAYQAAAARG